LHGADGHKGRTLQQIGNDGIMNINEYRELLLSGKTQIP
jgi:hypothetical protein